MIFPNFKPHILKLGKLEIEENLEIEQNLEIGEILKLGNILRFWKIFQLENLSIGVFNWTKSLN